MSRQRCALNSVVRNGRLNFVRHTSRRCSSRACRSRLVNSSFSSVPSSQMPVRCRRALPVRPTGDRLVRRDRPCWCQARAAVASSGLTASPNTPKVAWVRAVGVLIERRHAQQAARISRSFGRPHHERRRFVVRWRASRGRVAAHRRGVWVAAIGQVSVPRCLAVRGQRAESRSVLRLPAEAIGLGRDAYQNGDADWGRRCDTDEQTPTQMGTMPHHAATNKATVVVTRCIDLIDTRSSTP